MTALVRVAFPVLVGLALSVAPAAAQSDAAADSLPAGVTPEMVTQGKAIFTKTGLCFACHGATGQGAVCPNLTADPWIHGDGSYSFIVSTVTTGVTKEQSKSGVVMPPKGGSSISEDDVKAVAAYVWTLSRGKTQP
jgi:mono/diheme cytochrome c family protein